MSLEDKLFLVKRSKDKKSHITIDNVICKSCNDKVCLTICPAKCYEELHGQIKAAYENCLECGSCRISCTNEAINWKYPRGGFGVTFI